MSFCLTAALAQTTVKGKVWDEFGETVIGANVLEKGTSNGTITDLDGNYSLVVSNASKAVLRFSYVGYNTKETAVKGQSVVNVSLEPSVVNLGEVVAIGYGTQTRREITGSVANVSEEDFNKGISCDAADLLRGKVAGLTVTSGSGDVTRGSQIRLRGTSTLQNDQGPMIVIDGIPGGDLSTVSPSDIESISVLKDASSQAIYGSRAAGGVILITTKRGSGSKMAINYNGYVSADVAANKPHLLSADEWRSVNRRLAERQAASPENQSKDEPLTAQQIYDAGAGKLDVYGADTDWLGAMLRTGFTQNHSISISGSGSKSNYRASYTYLDRNGIVRDNYINRHSFRLQFQQRAIDDRLRLGLTGSATLSDMRWPFGDNFVNAYNNAPVLPIKNPDGAWFTDNFGQFDQGNPVQSQELDYNLNKSNYFYGDGDIQFDILDGLNIKAHLYKSMFNFDRSLWRDPATRRGSGDNGAATRESGTRSRNLMEWTLNYDREFGKNKVSGIAGYSWENNMYQGVSAYATNFAVTSMGANNLQSGNTLKIGNVTSSKNAFKLISFYARAHYSYADRYMITATVRRDGSSKFGANHKWGTFPSVSAAWGLSQEDFMKDVSWISDLKLRAGYGITGNQDGLQPYKTLELYEASGTYYDNGNLSTAFKVSQNANPDLKWEETAMLNIGLDFTLFKGRVSGTIEWYDKKTSDMIYRYAVPTPTFVYNRIYANVGDMENKGIEFLLNVDAVRNTVFKYATSINLAHNKNEITRLSNDLYTTSRIYTGDPWIRGASGVTSHVIEEGRPVGQFFMLHALGMDKNGKIIMEDINKDGQISDDDRTYVGDAQPDLTYGWNHTFRYKNWDAGVFIRGTVGNKVLNNPLAAYGNNTYVSGANAIMNDNLLKYTESSRVSSFYLENASFARLDNMSIGYTFNTKGIDWLERARIYVAGQNLFVLTKYTGLDPEVELFRGSASDADAGLSPGIEPRSYFPKSRSFTFGVNLTF
ncbi:MAG: SusC/RagA family TonB-linked outer membrane protein [Bacteroidales bacterium]